MYRIVVGSPGVHEVEMTRDEARDLAATPDLADFPDLETALDRAQRDAQSGPQYIVIRIAA